MTDVVRLCLTSAWILGPCNVVNSTSTEYNPYGWNDKANIFFVEQPVGVGFSYADYGELVVSETTACNTNLPPSHGLELYRGSGGRHSSICGYLL